MDDLLEEIAELKIKYGKEVFARIRLKTENAELKKENEKMRECLERIRLDNRGRVFSGMINNYLKQTPTN